MCPLEKTAPEGAAASGGSLVRSRRAPSGGGHQHAFLTPSQPRAPHPGTGCCQGPEDQQEAQLCEKLVPDGRTAPSPREAPPGAALDGKGLQGLDGAERQR